MLVGLALAGAIPFAFLLGFRRGVAALLFIRPLCDRIFESGRFDIGGHAISYGALIDLIVICVFLLYINQLFCRVPYGLRTAWLPFLLIAFVAVLYSPVQIDAARKFITYVTFAAMFMFAFLVEKSDRDATYWLKLVILSSVLPVVYGLFQTASGLDWYVQYSGSLQTASSLDTHAGSRIAGTFSHPNIFAFFLLTIIGNILILLVTDRGHMSQRLRMVLNTYLIPLFLLLVMTKTRSAWAASVVLLFVYGLVYDKRALLILLVVPLIAFAVPAISDRIMDIAARNDYIGGAAGANLNAYAWRKMLWDNAFIYIWERPLFGYGLNSFHFYSPTFFPLSPRGTEAHNVFIQFIFEIGFVGLCCFVWTFLRYFIWLARYLRVDRRGTIMTMAILSLYLILCYSDNVLEYLSFNWCFWFSCGAIFQQLVQTRSGIVQLPRRAGQRLGRLGVRHVGAA
jgi:putative inorganic carbon (HCO3(-)) transporter